MVHKGEREGQKCLKIAHMVYGCPLAQKTEARLNLVRADTDKATEESKAALEKIQQRFFDDILFPKLIVKGIRYLHSLH